VTLQIGTCLDRYRIQCVLDAYVLTVDEFLIPPRIVDAARWLALPLPPDPFK